MLLYKNLKPSPYIADTVRHLYALAAGHYTGFKFANDDHSLPLDFLQNVFVEDYGLKYSPSIFHPAYITHDDSHQPIYYSLEWPTVMAFSPKSDRQATKLVELRDIKHILEVTLMEVLENVLGVTTESIIYQIAKQVEFRFYHSNNDKFNVVENTSILPKHDKTLLLDQKKHNLPFCDSSRLIRGCIGIGLK
jgi:hypothetical protein